MTTPTRPPHRPAQRPDQPWDRTAGQSRRRPHRPGPRPYPYPQPPPRTTLGVLRAVLRAVAAAAALVALLVGLPAVLIAAAGWPFPHTIPTWEQTRDLLTGPGLPDEILINTLACLGWLAWAPLALSAVVELAAAVPPTIL